MQQNNQQMLESVAVIFKKASDNCVFDKKCDINLKESIRVKLFFATFILQIYFEHAENEYLKIKDIKPKCL